MDFGDASLAALIAGVLSIVGGVLLWWLTKYSKAAQVRELQKQIVSLVKRGQQNDV
jgi:membrane protein YqaA with SNARE-associated domain